MEKTAVNQEKNTDETSATQTIPVTAGAVTTGAVTTGAVTTTGGAPESAASGEPLIGIDEFSRVQLKVGQILSAERLEKSEKLLKLRVDVGDAAGPRQILSGIAKQYTPESLPGRKIVVVANLKPAKLMGQLSEGMLLAACDDEGNLELVSPGAAIPVGSSVR